ncbi:hypothetical protein GCM10022232_64220 [Streptomyces plumbiresistens]|uniref:Uncharacterized protein n=1 Tax=Streptomyces plumbiresistens TaxID=511811 RepID=A0ABP7SKS9_9ACTN
MRKIRAEATVRVTASRKTVRNVLTVFSPVLTCSMYPAARYFRVGRGALGCQSGIHAAEDCSSRHYRGRPGDRQHCQGARDRPGGDDGPVPCENVRGLGDGGRGQGERDGGQGAGPVTDAVQVGCLPVELAATLFDQEG